MTAAGRRVLIAGCGDLGTRLAARLAATGDSVTALSRSPRALPAGSRWLRADLADPATLRDLPWPLDAAVFLPTPDRREPAAYRAVFVDGLRALLDALPAPPPRLLFVSSTAVYGEDGGEAVDERTPPRPCAFNGQVLLEGERLAQARVPGAVVLRLAGIYGRGDGRMRRRARADEPGAPRWTNRIHVEDAAEALSHVLGLAAPAPCYCVADDRPEREDRLLAWLRDPAGLPACDPCPQQPEQGRRVLNHLLRASGWRPRHADFRSGYAGLSG